MLNAISIGNFKAFAEQQRIPICPLTLIYGANSSGKSSVLHSLLLIQHALETGNLDVYQTKAGGKSVDLGGFRQFIYSQDMMQRVKLSLDLDLELMPKQVLLTEKHLTSSAEDIIEEIQLQIKNLLVSLYFGLPIEDGTLLQFEKPEMCSYNISVDNENLIQIGSYGGKLELEQLNHNHPFLRKLIDFHNKNIFPPGTLVSPDYLDDVSFVREGVLLPEGLSRPVEEDGFVVNMSSKQEAVEDMFIRLFRTINNEIYKELKSLRYLGPLRSYPSRHSTFSRFYNPDLSDGRGNAWNVVHYDENVREKINHWLSSGNRLQTPYELVVRSFIDIEQLDESLFNTSEALTIQEEILYSRDDIEYFQELAMIDKRSNTLVSHRDIGVGISQVLPILAKAYASQRKIIAVEQPEIHLHPALQADLGDVFIESALGGSRNRFLIETHSENLLLRIMRRIRQTRNGELPDGIPEITPEDICLLFVQPNENSSVILHLELDEEGCLLDPWPGGFFEEGYRERFE